MQRMSQIFRIILGTHWAWEIINMVLQQNTEYRKDIKEALMLEATFNLDTLNKAQSTRVLNTHLPYRWLPKKHIENGGKIIHVTRNPKDMYVSYFHHAAGSQELGKKALGMTWNQYFDNYVMGKGNCLYCFEEKRQKSETQAYDKSFYTHSSSKKANNPPPQKKKKKKTKAVQNDCRWTGDDKLEYLQLTILCG